MRFSTVRLLLMRILLWFPCCKVMLSWGLVLRYLIGGKSMLAVVEELTNINLMLVKSLRTLTILMTITTLSIPPLLGLAWWERYLQLSQNRLLITRIMQVLQSEKQATVDTTTTFSPS